MHNTLSVKRLIFRVHKGTLQLYQENKEPTKNKGFEKTFNERRYTNDQEAP